MKTTWQFKENVGWSTDDPASSYSEEATLVALLKANLEKQSQILTELQAIKTALEGTVDVSVV
jgi:hypothetical protein